MNNNLISTKKPFFIALGGIIAALIAFILPYCTMTDKNIGAIATLLRGSNRLNLFSLRSLFVTVAPETSTTYTIIMAVMIVSLLIALVFELTKHPVGTLIFTILSGAVYSLFTYGFIETLPYGMGLGFGIWVSIAGYAVAVVGSIMHISAKHKEKKQKV